MINMNANRAEIRFYGLLNDFLEEEKRENSIIVEFNMNPSAKDLIESLGIPHVEVYKINVNTREESLGYNVQSGDRVEVFSKSFIPNSEEAANLPVCFIADVHLGKLTRLLRLLGFDTAYGISKGDKQIVELSTKEKRAVLTRDIDLLKHGKLKYGYWLRSVDPDQQVLEVIRYFELKDKIDPFSRCLECNGMLVEADYNDIAGEIPDRVKEWCDEYKQCNQCQKVYWRGSHYDYLKKKVNGITDEL